jgi:hypothetical protein
LEATDVDATSILAIAVLAVAFVNVVDWLVIQRQKFLWTPQGRGPGLYVWWACVAAIVATAIGVLAGWMSPWVMPWIGMPPFILQQLVSIWMRHSTSRLPQA